MDRKELLKNAKPILFNTEMVRAILDGRKTVTRRVVKTPTENVEKWFKQGILKPPYQPGDILYVRETWNHYTYDNLSNRTHKEGYFYKASSDMKSKLPDFVQYHWREKWKPSIHMPKEAARIFLKVTDVRVERLQDITDGEAKREGSQPQNPFDYDVNKWPNKEHFKEIWNSTIKKSDIDIYGWDANPWVWVIEFERIEV